MEDAVGQEFTHWTVVPSLKQPVAAVHPLRGMVSMAAPGRELGVTRAAAVVNPRDVIPENFLIPEVDLADAHFLIIDDTWTTGGHAMSLAVALKQTGAARASVIQEGLAALDVARISTTRLSFSCVTEAAICMPKPSASR